MAPMKLILEMEIGITGGVEDGVDNSGAAKDPAARHLVTPKSRLWQFH